MPTNDFLPYLQHHGILGMKWGVRRYQNEDGSYTALGRQHRGLTDKERYSLEEKTGRSARRKQIAKRIAIGIGIAGLVSGGVAASIHLAETGQLQKAASFVKEKAEEAEKQQKAYKNILRISDDADKRLALGKNACDNLSKVPLSELGNKQETINAGKKIFRVVDLPDGASSEVLNGRRQLYVNQDVRDHARYIPLLANYTNNPNRYSVTYEAKKQITLPSERQQMITFMSLMNNEGFRKRHFGQIDKTNLRAYYPTFMRQLGSNEQLSKEFSSALVSRGYEAFRDHADRGFFSGTATVLLNPENKIKLVKAKKIVGDSKIILGMKATALSDYA